jgi:hypothetical protein
MAIIDKLTTQQSIKGQKSMSNTLKTQDWDMNCFNSDLYRMQIIDLETFELEFLIDIYSQTRPSEFKQQLELITAELEFRKTPLAKELY